jgi:hypothetical protein
MSRRKNQKSSLRVEELEARDTPSVPAFSFSTGIYRAADAMPSQAQAAEQQDVQNDLIRLPDGGETGGTTSRRPVGAK